MSEVPEVLVEKARDVMAPALDGVMAASVQDTLARAVLAAVLPDVRREAKAQGWDRAVEDLRAGGTINPYRARIAREVGDS